MGRHAWTGLVFGLLGTVPTTAPAHAAPIRMGSADTRITVQAGASAPRLLELARPGGVPWRGTTAAALIGHARIGGREMTLHWRLDPGASRSDERSACLVYQDRVAGLRLYWTWHAPARSGPVEHTVRIENRSGHEVWLPLQDSVRFAWTIAPDRPLQQVWIDKGAGEAPPVGTHRVAIVDGHHWLGRSSTFAHPRAGEPREIIPWFMVRSDDARLGGWYVGVEFSGRVAMRLQRHGATLDGAAGLDPEPGPFRTRLAPGESFTTPTVFVGASDGDVDDTGNALRRWVREVLNDPATLGDPAYPLATNNSWGSAMAIDEAQARRMIDDAQRLGLEMFHLDAGWFRAVGDWRADPRKFPHGVAALADYAHRRGLRFGLWAAWAQAGSGTGHGALDVRDPKVRGWLTTDPPPGWTPAGFKGMAIDLGVPAAQAWATGETRRMVRDYHLDMLEHDGYVVAQGCDRNDHPHAPADPARTRRYRDDDFLWVDGDNATDVSLHATRAYYAIQRALKRMRPGLLLEVCNDGGRMVDFGSAAHGDYFSIVDAYDPLSNRQAFYDASHVLPPAMLETYVKAWPTPRIENFRYMLRSGMQGWFTVMIDTTGWTPDQHAAAAREIAFYRSTLRPLIRGADLYHVGPRPDGKGWDGTEYVDAARGRGVLYAFRGEGPSPSTYRFVLRGLRGGQRYRLQFRDRSSPDRVLDGHVLTTTGVAVTLPVPDSSELVVIERLP